MKTFPQIVTACFSVSDLGMDVTVENLPFDWRSDKDRDAQGATVAAQWLFENAPECLGKSLSLVWVCCRPAQKEATA